MNRISFCNLIDYLPSKLDSTTNRNPRDLNVAKEARLHDERKKGLPFTHGKIDAVSWRWLNNTGRLPTNA